MICFDFWEHLWIFLFSLAVVAAVFLVQEWRYRRRHAKRFGKDHL